MTTGPLILVIDDELQIRRFLRITLESIGYRVHEAVTGAEGLTEAATQRPDLVILDLGLPDEDGLNILKRLREWSHVPVIVLSVRNSDTDIIALLDAGADDYLTKPFSVGELQARLRLALRHTQPTPETAIFQSGALTVDLSKRLVTVNNETIKLTTTEYAMLRLFIQHAGRVLTHAQILREVWGPGYAEETHYLRVYVASLRKKIEADPANPRLITTEPGVGYRLIL
jgi:two-component system KDP operon response regulator KdpE